MLHSLSRFHLSRRGLLGLCAGMFTLTGSAAGVAGAATYGAKVKYQKGQSLGFADFEVTYLGARKVSSPTYPRGFVYHDFEVSRGSSKKTVSWTSGTGDIGPTAFAFGGRSFLLELSRSDKLGWLAAGELVIRVA